MKVSREILLAALEAVTPGLSPRDIIDQSACVVFDGKSVVTFNDHIACRMKLKLDIKGAVQAKPLLEILRKHPDDELVIELKKNEFRLVGKKRQTGIGMESEILLPIDRIEKPKKWNELPEDFGAAVRLCIECAAKDESTYPLTCVHLTPKHMEACDGYKAIRYQIKLKLSEPCLIRKDTITHLHDLGMTEVSETSNWLHFRNPAGLTVSCRRYVEEYKELKSILKMKGGVKTALPKGLAGAAERARIFSMENADDDEVLIELKSNKLVISGKGVSGWHREQREIKYAGQPMSFRISPDLLTDVTTHYEECTLNSNKMEIDGGGKYRLIISLGKPGGGDDE